MHIVPVLLFAAVVVGISVSAVVGQVRASDRSLRERGE